MLMRRPFSPSNSGLYLIPMKNRIYDSFSSANFFAAIDGPPLLRHHGLVFIQKPTTTKKRHRISNNDVASCDVVMRVSDDKEIVHTVDLRTGYGNLAIIRVRQHGGREYIYCLASGDYAKLEVHWPQTAGHAAVVCSQLRASLPGQHFKSRPVTRLVDNLAALVRRPQHDNAAKILNWRLFILIAQKNAAKRVGYEVDSLSPRIPAFIETHTDSERCDFLD
jgi:hypothetical protein